MDTNLHMRAIIYGSRRVHILELLYVYGRSTCRSAKFVKLQLFLINYFHLSVDIISAPVECFPHYLN